MKPDLLDLSLKAYARQNLPPCPDQLTANVWRGIKRRRRLSVWTRLYPILDWHELFTEPRLAIAAVGLAMVVGLVPALLSNNMETEKRLTRESLHFHVFSSQAPLALLKNTGSNPRVVQP